MILQRPYRNIVCTGRRLHDIARTISNNCFTKRSIIVRMENDYKMSSRTQCKWIYNLLHVCMYVWRQVNRRTYIDIRESVLQKYDAPEFFMNFWSIPLCLSMITSTTTFTFTLPEGIKFGIHKWVKC